MILKNYSLHFRIVNLWLFFLLLLTTLSNFPHQVVPSVSWFNCSVYFLIFLQCIFIARKASHNKAIFLNLGLFCLANSLTFVSLFIGEEFLFGDIYLKWQIFQYRTLLLDLLLVLSIVFICVKYTSNTQKTWVLYGLSFIIILPIFLWHYYPYVMDPYYTLKVDDLAFSKSALYFRIFPFFAVCYYGFLLYQNDKSLGLHINSLMVCFFILTLMTITDSFGEIYNIKLFSLSQFISLFILSVFAATMFQKLNYIHSDFGQFYESLIVSGNQSGVPIKRRKNPTLHFFASVARDYFNKSRNSFWFSLFSFLLVIKLLDFPLYLKMNVAAILIAALAILFYLAALYQKRLKKGELM